jgi:GxxExxY protein
MISEPERQLDQLTERIIGAAIEVHRAMGPGLLESAYQQCLHCELSELGLSFRRQVDLPTISKGIKLDCGDRIDLLVEDAVVVEPKTVEKLLPVRSAQLLTYQGGWLLNFNEAILKRGAKRLVNQFGESADASQKTCRPGVPAVK